MATLIGGFGTGPFGAMPFGSSSPSASPSFLLLNAVAVRENCILAEFTIAPKFTRLLDSNDASNPFNYTMTALDVVRDRYDNVTRSVSVIEVEQVDGTDGTSLYLWVDRPMSSEPCMYELQIAGLKTEAGIAFQDTTVSIVGLFKGVVPFLPSNAVNNRDIANPQSRSSLVGLPISSGQSIEELLGSFNIDAGGDIAIDEGIPGVHKRIVRRLTTKRGRFLHLPNYGVSVINSVKQLSRPGLRELLASEAESQIRLEPEVLSASVQIVVDTDNPSVARYKVRARTNFGEIPQFDVKLQYNK